MEPAWEPKHTTVPGHLVCLEHSIHLVIRNTWRTSNSAEKAQDMNFQAPMQCVTILHHSSFHSTHLNGVIYHLYCNYSWRKSHSIAVYHTLAQLGWILLKRYCAVSLSSTMSAMAAMLYNPPQYPQPKARVPLQILCLLLLSCPCTPGKAKWFGIPVSSWWCLAKTATTSNEIWRNTL